MNMYTQRSLTAPQWQAISSTCCAQFPWHNVALENTHDESLIGRASNNPLQISSLVKPSRAILHSAVTLDYRKIDM